MNSEKLYLRIGQIGHYYIYTFTCTCASIINAIIWRQNEHSNINWKLNTPTFIHYAIWVKGVCRYIDPDCHHSWHQILAVLLTRWEAWLTRWASWLTRWASWLTRLIMTHQMNHDSPDEPHDSPDEQHDSPDESWLIKWTTWLIRWIMTYQMSHKTHKMNHMTHQMNHMTHQMSHMTYQMNHMTHQMIFCIAPILFLFWFNSEGFIFTYFLQSHKKSLVTAKTTKINGYMNMMKFLIYINYLLMISLLKWILHDKPHHISHIVLPDYLWLYYMFNL